MLHAEQRPSPKDTSGYEKAGPESVGLPYLRPKIVIALRCFLRERQLRSNEQPTPDPILHAPGNSSDGPFDKIINYTRDVIIRTHGDYFSQTKAASGLNRSIGCVEILYAMGSEMCALAR